jgi:formylglycine-generating enzyme required for sulfatase activity
MTDQLTYDNFDVLIQRWDGKQYHTHLLHSPAGESHSTLTLATADVIVSLKSLRHLVLDDDTGTITGAARLQQAQQLGALLFDSLMSNEIRSCFDVSLTLTRNAGKGLRIRLRIEPPELAALPWELMFDRRTSYFPALSNRTPVVRYVELQQNVLPLAAEYPLNILVVISSPSDQAPLNINREMQHIHRALSPLEQAGKIRFTVMQGATVQTLRRQLLNAEYHVLHYSGHGHYSAQDGEGYLIFEDDDHSSVRVNSSRLGMLLRDEHSLRLVVLNACSSAQHGDSDSFSGVATGLVRAGSPAVLAMQSSVTDGTARQFTAAFYQSLADGCSIDMAVSEGRKEIEFLSKDSFEWAIPQLYIRVPDGVLFTLRGVKEAGDSLDLPRRPPPQDSIQLPTGTSKPVIYQPVVAASMASSPHPIHPAPLPLPAASAQARPSQVEMQSIPAGEFVSGTGQRIYVPEFSIDPYPVTNAQYLRFIEATGAAHPATWTNGIFPRPLADHPVTGISWEQAAAYASWAGKRLLTAMEWEKAARGTDGRRYPWGNEFDPQYCNVKEAGRGTTAPVGEFSRDLSPYGVYDMAGNVQEWVADEVKPRGLGNPKIKRAVKGGSWAHSKAIAESAMLGSEWPDTRQNYIGFRCAR